jgi:diketogulonate reductase-like aldo/keto reductase
MRRHLFGSTRHEVPVIGQGTWYIEQADRLAAVATLRRGIDLGLTHIDTAEMYGEGAAEAIVGEAIHGRRDQVFLVSKVLPQHASRTGIPRACEQSLARLKTDRLDSYLLHWPGPHPLRDTIYAFEALKKEGKILSWGVSNFDVPLLDEVWRISGRHCVCNQVMYHLLDRAIENDVLPWCEQHGVAVTGYSPFGHGQFPGPDTEGGRTLADIGWRHDKTARQVALAFLTRRPSLLTIPKASSQGHAEENAGAGDLLLSKEEIDRIDAVFPIDPARPLPTL